MKESKKQNKQDMSKMSKLLLSGASMLSDSCPDCKIPLFKKNEVVFCPQCERKVVYVTDEKEIKEIEQQFSLDDSVSQLKDVLAGKLNYFTNQLASMENTREISDVLEMIEKILTIVEKVKE
jgi:UPF0148 protein